MMVIFLFFGVVASCCELLELLRIDHNDLNYKGVGVVVLENKVGTENVVRLF